MSIDETEPDKSQETLQTDSSEPLSESTDKQEGSQADSDAADTVEKTIASDKSEKDQRQNDQPKSNANVSTIVLAVLVILLGAGSGYLGWQQLQLQNNYSELASRVNKAEQSAQANAAGMERAAKQQKQSQTELEALLRSSHKDSRKASEQLQQQIAALAERVNQSETVRAADWRFAQGEYLLQIANQRLHTERDIEGALLLLQSVDDILRESAYPEMAPVRNALIADKTRLKGLALADIEGIYFELQALNDEISRLDLFRSPNLNAADNDQKVSASQETGWSWSAIKANFWSAVSGIIVISSKQTIPDYLISNDLMSLKRAAMVLQVRNAQLALMNGETEIYTGALTAAAEELALLMSGSTRHISSEGVAIQAVMDRLNELAQTPIQNPQVNIDSTVNAFSSVLNQLTGTVRQPSSQELQ